jgi:phosphohistidine phosphatase
MRTLHLLRHAKSSRDNPALADHDRPLAPRGVDAAARIAEHLRATGTRPEVVLCSSSRRTVETLDLLRPALGSHVKIHIERGIYHADEDEVLERLRLVEPAVASVMVIGHNPTMQYLTLGLARDGNTAAMRQMHTKFPTAALATLSIHDTPWAQLGRGDASLASVVLPSGLDPLPGAERIPGPD